MNILCAVFGHRPVFGYGHREGEGYFRMKYYATDGLGTAHMKLFCDCERCGVNYQVGMVHLPKDRDRV